LTYVDRIDLSETFADAVENIVFDAGLVRIEFVVQRPDRPKPRVPSTAKRIPVARLILPTSAAIKLAADLNMAISTLTQQGILQPVTPVQPPPRGEVN
jgi:hypothetical protein